MLLRMICLSRLIYVYKPEIVSKGVHFYSLYPLTKIFKIDRMLSIKYNKTELY
jgi:hypothetical protein